MRTEYCQVCIVRRAEVEVLAPTTFHGRRMHWVCKLCAEHDASISCAPNTRPITHGAKPRPLDSDERLRAKLRKASAALNKRTMMLEFRLWNREALVERPKY